LTLEVVGVFYVVGLWHLPRWANALISFGFVPIISPPVLHLKEAIIRAAVLACKLAYVVISDRLGPCSPQ